VNGTSKKKGLLREFSSIWENGMLRAVFLLVLVLLANFIFQQALVLILKTERPLHTPISGSMWPTLKIGDLLIIQGGLGAEDIYANPQDGDIIIFHDPRNPSGIPIVHRAIEKFQEGGRWYFTTKGDNNVNQDIWPVPEDYMLGRVIVAIPLLGYFLRFLDETEIHLAGQSVTLRTVIIIVLIVAFFFLEYTSTEEKEQKPQETGGAGEEEEGIEG
jgi:signal peptidase